MNLQHMSHHFRSRRQSPSTRSLTTSTFLLPLFAQAAPDPFSPTSGYHINDQMKKYIDVTVR